MEFSTDVEENDGATVPADTGMVVRALVELLNARQQLLRRGISVTISLQFLEIYDEQVF